MVMLPNIHAISLTYQSNSFWFELRKIHNNTGKASDKTNASPKASSTIQSISFFTVSLNYFKLQDRISKIHRTFTSPIKSTNYLHIGK